MDEFDLTTIIMITILILFVGLCITGVLVNYHYSNEACSDFGGKYNGESCVKDGYAYDVQNKNFWGLKKQIVKPVIAMEANSK